MLLWCALPCHLQSYGTTNHPPHVYIQYFISMYGGGWVHGCDVYSGAMYPQVRGTAVSAARPLCTTLRALGSTPSLQRLPGNLGTSGCTSAVDPAFPLQSASSPGALVLSLNLPRFICMEQVTGSAALSRWGRPCLFSGLVCVSKLTMHYRCNSPSLSWPLSRSCSQKQGLSSSYKLSRSSSHSLPMPDRISDPR